MPKDSARLKLRVRVPKSLAGLPGMMHGVTFFTDAGYYIRTRCKNKSKKKKEQPTVPDLVIDNPSPTPAKNDGVVSRRSPVDIDVQLEPLTPATIPPLTSTEESPVRPSGPNPCSSDEASVATPREAQNVTDFDSLWCSFQTAVDPSVSDLAPQVVWAPQSVAIPSYYHPQHGIPPSGSGNSAWNPIGVYPDDSGFCGVLDTLPGSAHQTTDAYPGSSDSVFDYDAYLASIYLQQPHGSYF